MPKMPSLTHIIAAYFFFIILVMVVGLAAGILYHYW